MKRLLLLFMLLCIDLMANGQSHGMKYFFNEVHKCWNLKDSTAYRTDTPIVKLDGIPGNPRIAFAKEVTEKLDIQIVKEVLGDLIPRYKARGMEKFGITYIILPNGDVDELSFNFPRLDRKPYITEEEMVIWRRLSDELKRQIKYTVPDRIEKFQFYRMSRLVILSEILHLKENKSIRADSKLKLTVRPYTEEDRRKLDSLMRGTESND